MKQNISRFSNIRLMNEVILLMANHTHTHITENWPSNHSSSQK